MRKPVLLLLVKQVLGNAYRNKGVMVLTGIVLALLGYAAISGYATYQKQTATRLEFQKK